MEERAEVAVDMVRTTGILAVVARTTGLQTDEEEEVIV
jgi:hypothetical protein